MKPMRRTLFFLVPVLVFVIIGVFLGIGLTRDPSVLPSALLDDPAPEFDLGPIEGYDKPGLAKADLQGEPALVNIFASWCVPCQVEHPQITALAEDGIKVHAINYKDEPEDAKKWLVALGDPFTRIGADPEGRAGIDWGVYGVPETFVVDAEGTIVYKHVGPIMEQNMDEIRAVIDKLQS